MQLAQFPNQSASIDPLLAVSARWVRIYNGQLYAGTDYAPPYLIQLGSGLPTGGAPTISTLPGGFTSRTSPPPPSPYAFVMFDLFPPAGPDTLYLADDGMNNISSGSMGSNTGGTNTGQGSLTKWTFSASTGWTQVTTWTLTAGSFGPDAGTNSNKPMGFRGLAGFATGTKVTLMATTGNNTGNPDSITYVLSDDGASTSAPTLNYITTSPLSQVYRGVALTPQ